MRIVTTKRLVNNVNGSTRRRNPAKVIFISIIARTIRLFEDAIAASQKNNLVTGRIECKILVESGFIRQFLNGRSGECDLVNISTGAIPGAEHDTLAVR